MVEYLIAAAWRGLRRLQRWLLSPDTDTYLPAVAARLDCTPWRGSSTTNRSRTQHMARGKLA